MILPSAVLAATALRGRFTQIDVIGSLVGTIGSAGFLPAIAMADLAILIGILRALRRVGIAADIGPDTIVAPPIQGGPLSRSFKPHGSRLRHG